MNKNLVFSANLLHTISRDSHCQTVSAPAAVAASHFEIEQTVAFQFQLGVPKKSGESNRLP